MGTDTEEGPLKRIGIRLGQLALTLLVTWLIVDRVGLGMEELTALDPTFWTPDAPWLVGASCMLLLGGYFLSAALWGRIVADLGGGRLPASDAVRLFMVANLGRYVPGKVWQVAGLAALARQRGISAAVATGAAVLGQGIALVAAAVVGSGALLLGPPSARAWGTGALAGLVLAVVVGLYPPLFGRVVGLWFRLAGSEPPATLDSRRALGWMGLYLLNWCLYAFSFSVLVAGFGQPGLTPAVASSFAAAYVLGYLAIFAPAGIGVREGALVAFLTPHLGVAPAGAMAVVARLWATAVELVPAAAFWTRLVASPPAAETHPPEDAGE